MRSFAQTYPDEQFVQAPLAQITELEAVEIEIEEE
jgi:hypothetical protein